MIENNSYTAQSCATSISQAATRLADQGLSQKDNGSEYLGKTSASSAIDQENQATDQLASQLMHFVRLIQQTDQEFQAVDARLSSQIMEQIEVPTASYSADFTPRSGLF
ncbi:TIGR04197 family type VII secretion effector [Streptococcus suis]|uniref:TIGR04197 family type VII secretion effector n=1 Tax=Streptococcus suis TaxID=1307 RepID=UPI00042866A3|nr:TIGR04197 family type VII secretion effector [Streptococcus suis]MDD7565996.1 TIGR04197 family type VII secretion effector [Streptococcus suis]MDY5054771.1 TIGR04197 family type VII secretion effector [Streptococcus suis]